ncbi:MAG: hypothetical protein NC393_10440 [Clostridium sp.]|nr:hypothetical protein [Clostridium sp.]MCM1209537.1 hypothetical protein [Ruminococcus sp.]
MEIRILKLSNDKGAKDLLSAMDILSMHLGYFWIKGKVTYTTNIPISTQPDYALLTVGNEDNVCFLCHVDRFKEAQKEMSLDEKQEFMNYAPEKYFDDGQATWLRFDSMQKIPTDFLDVVLSDEKITDYIKSRANNKIIG